MFLERKPSYCFIVNTHLRTQLQITRRDPTIQHRLSGSKQFKDEELLAMIKVSSFCKYICLTKTTAGQNEDALSYYRVRGLYFMAVVYVGSIRVLGY